MICLHNIFILFIYFYVVLRIKPSALHVQGKHSATEPQPQPKTVEFLSANNYFEGWGCRSVVEHLTSMYEAPGQILSTA